MNKIDNFLKKSGNKFIGITIIAIFTWILGELLDWLTNRYTTDIVDLLKSKIELPVFGLILSLLIVALGDRAYKAWIINRRQLKIIKATYGTNETNTDITRELNKAVIDNKLKIVISNALAGDPIPGVPKFASVYYEYADRRENKNVNEGEVLQLP